MTRVRYILCLAALVALVACSGGSSKKSTTHDMTTTPQCTPAGTTLKIVATNVKFDKSCLAAPAGQAFTISLDNEDASISHNLSIYDKDPASDPKASKLFPGQEFVGKATKTYDVPALPSGIYHFHCDVHPTTMFGQFVVQ